MVSVEIRILSLYPAPLEALELLSKWFVLVLFACVNLPAASANHWPVFFHRFNISPLSVNISTSEFTLLASPPKVTFYFCALYPPLNRLNYFLAKHFYAGWREWGGHDGRGCPASATAALGDQGSRCGLHSLWSQTHHNPPHHQVLSWSSGPPV